MSDRQFEPMDRLVGLYQRFRDNGDSAEEAWAWAQLIVNAIHEAAEP